MISYLDSLEKYDYLEISYFLSESSSKKKEL